jgi:hypothetical protein
MDNLASGKRFENLLDLVEAEHAVWREEEFSDDVLERAAMRLGPCVGDDSPVQTIGGCPTAVCPSDFRLKHDVHRVGTTVFGLPLYKFKYIGEPETYEGVMAHEVLQVMPDAVSRGGDGYFRVNYSALGTSIRQVS